ncbi:hypothetical protein [Xenorhabdus griffiniae]|uniref:Uncharacterized protein n=1 Tax=Xenorhabdus griffiniae TaxID=351672 RepID=A0ABY9XLK3_9GAMM|nr:hypothetical protein [Xenorhabdus griffiniae]MBD1229598.1 hypothetical protein [Xenorhabdus griffiniae]MBE8589407.1 hypothetical protein [Xenorhabdus griffiniae]WMV73789.1 hypothetical protein QL128_07235 [Xenorhabdus griffiniae]WNH03470.1 hypothetical protein QL112_007240 [Xenorhabdus griffiniae]
MYTEKTRQLNFVLLEDIPFEELIPKLEKAFNINLPYKDIKGRYIAKAKLQEFDIELVDRIDQLGDFLCDDYHVMYIIVDSDKYFNFEFENKITSILKDGKIKWRYATWSKLEDSEHWRRIYPS